MKRRIYIKPLQKGFEVEVKSANKQKRNRYFSNASPCCKAKLQQKKFCSECQEEVGYNESNHKIIKLGKEEYVIESDALNQVQETLVEGDIEVHTFVESMPTGAVDRFDSLMYAKPVEKKMAQYKELSELLKDKVAVANAVFRNNEYQVVLTAEDGIIRIRKLIEESQRYDFDSESLKMEVKDTQINPEVIELEQKIIKRNMQEDFDITQFKDSRAEYEEEVIEKFIMDGEIPEIQTEVTKEQETDELQRLKALMGEQ